MMIRFLSRSLSAVEARSLSLSRSLSHPRSLSVVEARLLSARPERSRRAVEVRALLAILVLTTLFSVDCIAQKANAQKATADKAEIRALKHEISGLCSPTFSGRGYIAKGAEKAGQHIMREFKDAGLKPVSADSSYYQYYNFPVVTFPDSVMVKIKKKELIPGEDFLVDPAANSYHGKRKMKRIKLGALKDSTAWESAKRKLNDRRVYLLDGTDSLCRLLHIHPQQLSEILPTGAYIIPQKGKMNWSVSTDMVASTVLYVQDSVLPKRGKVRVDVNSRLNSSVKNSNVIAMVRGTRQPDSFIVLTAHYDHLGKMGYDATFPGASDNASGTAMLLRLADYYSKNPAAYSILFIAFSGEEAGLLGSSFYVQHPTLPLDKMRFLVNLDIMGNAQDGITVVNATEHPKEFSLLETLNKKGSYLPQIRSRGKARNSDHYYFSEAGVPAFFIYSNGGPGFYHDVFDKPNTVTLVNIDKVMLLLKDFVGAL
jgi:hypothetical protein